MNHSIQIGIYNILLLIGANYTKTICYKSETNMSFIANDSITDAMNFWNNFNFADTAYYGIHKGLTEKKFSDFIIAISHLPYIQAVNANNNLLSKTEKNETSFFYFWELFDKYYYNPDSPFCNDTLYIAVLSHIINSITISDLHKSRAFYQWELIHKNRIGQIAEDFCFTTISGDKKRLFEINSEYILLFFNLPDCEECSNVKNKLKQQHLPPERISIVSIYPYNDISLWNLTKYPKEWINGYDKELTIEKNRLYDLQVFPVIYLLDKDKKVVLKDPSIEELLTWFNKKDIQLR